MCMCTRVRACMCLHWYYLVIVYCAGVQILKLQQNVCQDVLGIHSKYDPVILTGELKSDSCMQMIQFCDSQDHSSLQFIQKIHLMRQTQGILTFLHKVLLKLIKLKGDGIGQQKDCKNQIMANLGFLKKKVHFKILPCTIDLKECFSNSFLATKMFEPVWLWIQQSRRI